MPTKIKLDRPVIVEGKYDKIKLSSILDTEIITTEGFGIFREEDKKLLIRRIAGEKGVFVLTDSDGAGLVIRNYFNSVLPKDKIIHLYIPQIVGKERRKKKASKEGFIGVEGTDTDTLIKIFLPYCAAPGTAAEKRRVTKLDFYEDGLAGGEGSAEKRRKLASAAGLPQNLSSNALLEAIKYLYSYEQYKELLKQWTNLQKDITNTKSE